MQSDRGGICFATPSELQLRLACAASSGRSQQTSHSLTSMRLEIEPTIVAPPFNDVHADDAEAAELKSMLSQGVKAAQAGNRPLARMCLRRATELDPRNESAWLWLASISEYPEELLGFLNHVLEVNPDNQRALEWRVATNALLAKTYVQRGVDACDENQKDFAGECFRTALEYDANNSTAYMWLASLASTNEAKVSMLQRALECDPGNEAATSALEDARADIVKDRLNEAKAAAISGDNAGAIDILDNLLSVNPESIDALTLKSHLAEGFDEKIRCFESILAIDPENLAARAGRDSLLSILGTMPTVEEECTHAAGSTRADETVDEVWMDKGPTQDLEVPEGFEAPYIEFAEESHRADTPGSQEENNDAPMQASAEPSTTDSEEAQDPTPSDLEWVAPTDFEPAAPVPTPNRGNENDPAHVTPGTETVAHSHEEADDFMVTVDDEPPSLSAELILPMPGYEPSKVPALTGYETMVITAEMLEAGPESFECMFCRQENEPQSISCHSCSAVLTLSDLELLLANQNADKLLLRQAVEEMERQRSTREFTADKLLVLGLGHLNLRNLQLGYSCLLEASKLQPDNVVLSGQVNELLIRLDEIRRQEEAHLRMPKGKMILVVDDSPTVRKLIAGKLEKSGHDVVCANDGVEAMERLADFIPDLILLDITMPRMDGYQVCKNIRSNISTKDVPVVMISGKDGFFDKVRGRMAGTTGYITKPFGPETLMKAVEMYLAGEVPDLDEV